MKFRTWNAGILVALAAVLASLLVIGAGCGGDDDNPSGSNGDVPESWVGLWLTSITFKDCVSHEEVFTFTDTTAICPDAEDYEETEEGMECDYSWDGNTMDVHCITYDTLGGCYNMSDVEWSSTVSGTSFTGEGTFVDTWTGEECEFEDACYDVEMTSTRIGDAPEPCDPFQDFDGGGNGGDLSGLEFDIVGASSDGTYEISDLLGATVVLDTVANEYRVFAQWAGGGATYILQLGFPGEGGPDWEFSTEAIEGKALVQFTKTVGEEHRWVLTGVTSGTLTVSEATDDAVSGDFTLAGDLTDQIGGGDPVAIAFQNGIFELSIDAKTSFPGKAVAARVASPRSIVRFGVDAIRRMSEAR